MGQHMHDRLFHVAIVCFGEPPQQDGKRARPILDEGEINDVVDGESHRLKLCYNRGHVAIIVIDLNLPEPILVSDRSLIVFVFSVRP